MSVNGPKTGFVTTNNGEGTPQDLGDRYVSKDYILDVYPNVVPGQTVPGLWAWGYNVLSYLGLNDAINRSSPVQVGTLTNWTQVRKSSNSSFAIKTDGTLWAWGNNGSGQLGLNQGSGSTRSSPTQVGTLNDWKTVYTNSFQSFAIRNNGTLWAWGLNTDGELGLNDIVSRSSPVQVGSLTNWAQVSNGVAIKTDGTLWAWGLNTYGELGLNNRIHRSSPVQVGNLTNWKQIDNACAVKTDGTLWAWGNNINGAFGLNDTVHRSSPTQVGTLNDWKTVFQYNQADPTLVGSNIGRSFAIKTDGTLYAWGNNDSGPLGLNDQNHRSSPVQVGNLTNWKTAFTSSSQAFAVKTDGTLWAWGYNNYGYLGLNDQVHRSSPVQVGTLSTWKQISGGLAIQDGYM